MKPFYEHGGITIYHGDCRDVSAVADLCLTDPPYSIKHTDGGGFAAGREFYAGRKLAGLTEFNLDEYKPKLRAFAPQLVAFHSRDQVIEYGAFCMQAFGNYDLHVWHKVNAIPFTHNTWKSDVEYIALGWSGKKNHAKVDQCIKSKVYQSGIETGNFHPTQKPLGLMLKYLRVLNPKTVIDPFMGSGTTLRAAKDMGIAAIGIEREERYCDIAAKRLAQNVFNFHAEASA